MKNQISNGTVHLVSPHIKKALVCDSELLKLWNNNTPLARNEWICFIESAKKEETRVGRLERLSNDLKKGKKRPCCWAGCSHR